MGGLISAYGVLRFPETFGMAGIFSPSYWIAFPSISDSILMNHKDLSKLRIVHYAGEKEDQTLVTNVRKINEALSNKKIPDNHIRTIINPEGQHSEKYWQSSFTEAYQWMFNPSSQKK
jgi:predicted alpha/beta superfamily hydrolase